MLVTCRHCGRIHERSYDCGQKKTTGKKWNPRWSNGSDEARFRWSQEWKDKRDEIRARDLNLCQCCIRGLYQYGNKRPLNYDDLSVHHAIPITQDWERRLDDSNLITLCSLHHEMAESGDIPYETIKAIISDQEAKKREKSASGAPVLLF